MDTSKKYIKMCKKAEEIQKGWNPREGDLGFLEKGKSYFHHFEATEDDEYNAPEQSYGNPIIILESFAFSVKEDGFIWLPRQDQLQEMIDWEAFSYKVSTQIFQINEFYDNLPESVDDTGYPTSMEQIWLMFVMSEKFGKEWVENDWQKKK